LRGAQIAAEFGVTRPTIYRYLDEEASPARRVPQDTLATVGWTGTTSRSCFALDTRAYPQAPSPDRYRSLIP